MIARFVCATLALAFLLCAPLTLSSVPVVYAQTTATVTPATPGGSTVTVAPTPSSQTVVDVGAIGGSVLTWLTAAFGSTIAAMIVALLFKVLQGMNITILDSRKAQLQGLVVNGLNWAAAKAREAAAGGKITVDVKSRVLADTINYVNQHGAELLGKMGVVPGTNEANVAIEARAEKALIDPRVPTPPEITPAAGKPQAVTVIAPAPAAA